MTRLRLGWSWVFFGVLGIVFLNGCGAGNLSGPANERTTASTKQGKVHGGQQPVSGTTLQLYAVGTTGDGSAATPLLTQAVTSDTNGEFTITGDYTCPSSSTLVYLVATGGNPGLAAGTNNADLAMMAALGPCGNLSPSTFIFVNELTTVAAVWALAPYMNSYSAIGSSPTDAAGLAQAFTEASELVDTTTGTTPGLNVPVGIIVPVSQLNTLADILAACVNTVGGAVGDGSTCGTLLAVTAYGSSTPPTNLIDAALGVVNHPTWNIANLFSLIPPLAPFQPALSLAPLSFVVPLTPPMLSVSTTTLTFPDTTIGFTAAEQDVTLTNVGTVILPLAQILYSGSISSFPVTSTCSASLDIGASCTLQIEFFPASAGQWSETIGFSSGAMYYPQQVTVTGKGVAGTNPGPITIAPSTLSFTEIGIPQTLTLTNASSTPLSIAGISIMSSVASSSSVYLTNYTQTNNCGTVLAAQSICNIYVTAGALVLLPQTVTGQVVVTDDSTSSPHLAQLSTTSNVLTGTPTPLSFGSWVVGTQNIPSLSFATGTSNNNPSFMLGAQITGPNASDFSATSLGCPFHCTDNVSFSPSALGLRVATLVTSVGNVPLSGIGTTPGPSLFLAPTYPLLPTFPITTAVNTSSAVLQYSVYDNGSTVIQPVISVSGPNASEFAVTNTCSSSISPAGFCSLNIVFSPLQSGSRSAMLTVTDSISGVLQTLSLTGNAKSAPPTVTPNRLDFTNVTVGGTTPPKILTITAPNGDPVTITGSMPSFFPLDPGSCWAATPCQVSVSFHASNSTFQSEGLVFTDSITGQNTVTTETGTPGVHALSLSSNSLMFAARNIGTISIPQTITLTSTGDLSLSILGVSMGGMNPGDYSIQSNNCTGQIAANATCSLSISFDPSASGASSATLQIVTNSATSPDVVQLSGTGN